MKNEVMKKKEKVDEKNVALQSLVYQKNNLMREIKICKSFQTTKLLNICSYPKYEPSDKNNYNPIILWLTEELAV